MSVVELLAELRKLDIHVALDGERLRLNAPAGALTASRREELQRRKPEIVEFLRTAQQLSSQQRAIVPLQPNGTQTPVFGVAGHNGDVFCYRTLAGHLGTDQPFFGLQPPGLEEGTEPLIRVEDLANYFARQIRAFRPHGPYTIIGFCAGGTMAFELARQLVQAGSQVTHLVLFGAPYCTSYRPLSQLTATSSYLAHRAFVHARALMTMPPSERRRYLSERTGALRPEETAAPTDPVLIRRAAVEKATLTAVRQYRPDLFQGHVDIMLPSESWQHSLDAPLRWGKLSKTSTQLAGPEGCNGDNMLLPQYAATFAALFEEAREQRRQDRVNEDPAHGH